jgi:hypothetical protein
LLICSSSSMEKSSSQNTLLGCESNLSVCGRRASRTDEAVRPSRAAGIDGTCLPSFQQPATSAVLFGTSRQWSQGWWIRYRSCLPACSGIALLMWGRTRARACKLRYPVVVRDRELGPGQATLAQPADIRGSSSGSRGWRARYCGARRSRSRSRAATPGCGSRAPRAPAARVGRRPPEDRLHASTI